mgnify:CR=1 FL=1
MCFSQVMVVYSNVVSESGTLRNQGVVHGRVGVRLGHRLIDIKRPRLRFCIATLNVGTMRGRIGEIVETVSRRKIDLCCLQETRWKGGSARMLSEKVSRYKFFWIGNNKETGGVDILLAEKYVDRACARNKQ